MPPDGDARTWAERLVDDTILAALAGDRAAVRLVWEYVEGRPSQAVGLSVSTGLGASDLSVMTDEELTAQAFALLDELVADEARPVPDLSVYPHLRAVLLEQVSGVLAAPSTPAV